jgi:hypothetical protein
MASVARARTALGGCAGRWPAEDGGRVRMASGRCAGRWPSEDGGRVWEDGGRVRAAVGAGGSDRSGWAKETESGSGAGAHFGLSPLTSVGLSQSMKVITVTSVDH